jgi:hypothetical protein
VQIVLKCGSLSLLEPSEHVQALQELLYLYLYLRGVSVQLYTALPYVDDKVYSCRRPLKDLCVVLFKNYVKIIVLRDIYCYILYTDMCRQ